MSTKTIVCGVDGSGAGLDAIDVAGRLAEQLRLPVVAVHVIDDANGDGELAAARRLLAAAIKDRHFTHGVQPVVEVGHPADRLLEAAQTHDAALLVVGSSRDPFATHGSVSAETSKQAPCPVVVVPPDAEDQLDNGDQPTMSFEGGIARFHL